MSIHDHLTEDRFDVSALGAYLDALDQSTRVREVRTLSGREQVRLLPDAGRPARRQPPRHHWARHEAGQAARQMVRAVPVRRTPVARVDHAAWSAMRSAASVAIPMIVS